MNLGAPINSAALEAYAALADGGNTLVFAADARGKPNEDFDLFVARRVDGRWGEARRIEGVNSDGNETAPHFAGGRLHFSSTRAKSSGRVRFDASRRESWLKSPGNGLGDPYSVPLSAIITGSSTPPA